MMGADSDAGLSRHGLCRLRGAAARALRQPAAAALLRGVPPARRSRHRRGAGARRHHDPGLGRVRLRDARRSARAPAARRVAENLNALARRARPGGRARPAAGDARRAVESVSLVVAWFGDDLRAGALHDPARRRGGGEGDDAAQLVGQRRRAAATPTLVSRDAEGRPVYGGTPADFAVVQAIQEMKARGLRRDLLSVHPDGRARRATPCRTRTRDNAAETGQPAFPWRGRITCSPAAGYAGTRRQDRRRRPRRSRRCFGAAQPSDFAVSGESVSWTGPSGDWGLRRMILHYAHLCAAAGGVDAFLIGSEMRGLTTVRSGAATYPAVQAFRDLARRRAARILGAGTKISYAADWSEYFGHQPDDGSGDVFFHLDPLWADADIDFVGIDNYMPLSDWRDGCEHARRAGGLAGDLRPRLPAGEHRGRRGLRLVLCQRRPTARRRSARRSPTAPPASRGCSATRTCARWWSNQHFNRPGGVESGAPTAWVAAVEADLLHRGSAARRSTAAPTSRTSSSTRSRRRASCRTSRAAGATTRSSAPISRRPSSTGATPANNPVSSVYGGRMVESPRCAAWTWDARPYPFFPELGRRLDRRRRTGGSGTG